MKNEPLYIKLSKQIKQEIVSDLYPPGTNLPSIDKLKTKYGHSKNTVIHALLLLLEQGMIQRAGSNRNGFTVTSAGRRQFTRETTGRRIVQINLPTSRWNTVGIELLKEIEIQFAELGINLLLSNNGNSIEEETHVLNSVLNHNSFIADVLILMTSRSINNPNIEQLKKIRQRIPVILLDREIFGFNSHYVGVDNLLIGFQATEFLISKGYREIGFLSYSSQCTPSIKRGNGYITSLLANGIEINQNYIFRKIGSALDGIFINSLEIKISELLRETARLPEAWVCSTDKEAAALIDILYKEKLDKNEFIPVTGCDNDGYVLKNKAYLPSTFKYPLKQIAFEVAQLSERLIRNPGETIKKVEFPAVFIEHYFKS